MGFFGTERWPSDKTFEHNGAHRPPIAAKVVSKAAKDLGRDVVWSAHGRVGQLSTGLSPRIDLRAVADS